MAICAASDSEIGAVYWLGCSEKMRFCVRGLNSVVALFKAQLVYVDEEVRL